MKKNSPLLTFIIEVLLVILLELNIFGREDWPMGDVHGPNIL